MDAGAGLPGFITVDLNSNGGPRRRTQCHNLVDNLTPAVNEAGVYWAMSRRTWSAQLCL
jgi:hypothetical protein